MKKNSAWSIFEEKWYLLMDWKSKDFQFKSRLIQKSIRWKSLSCLHSAQWLFLFEIVQKSDLFFCTMPDPSVGQKWFRTSPIFWGAKNTFWTWVQKQNCLEKCHFLHHFKKLKFSQNHFGPTESLEQAYTVWSVNDGLFGNLWKPPETSRRGFRQVFDRFPAGFRIFFY